MADINLSDIIRFIVDGFNKRMQEDTEFREKMKHFKRVIIFDIGGETYAIHIANNKAEILTDDKVRVSAMIIMIDSKKTFLDLISGKISPIRAVGMGKLKIRNATPKEMIFLKDVVKSDSKTISHMLEDYKRGEARW